MNGLLRCARNDGSIPFMTPGPNILPIRKTNNDRSRGPGISGHPGTHHHARRSAAGDASSGARHLFRSDDRTDRQPARAISSKLFATKGNSYIYIANGHGAWEAALVQRAVARRQGAGAGERPLCDRLGQCRGGDGRRGRSAEGRLAPRDPPRRSRSAAAAGQGSRHQGHPRGAGRYRLRRIQRHRGDRQGDQGGRSSGAVHGRRGGLARLHAVRDGRTGASTSRCPARRRA